MNEIRQLCTSSSSPGKHLDEILALFHACPPQHLLPSLSLIGQSISCMSIEQLDSTMVAHRLFIVIRQWAERLLQLWLVNGTLNGDEHRALFYTNQLFQLLTEWLTQQEIILNDDENQEITKTIITELFIEQNFIATLCRVIDQLIAMETNNEQSIPQSESSNTAIDHVSDDDEKHHHISPDDVHLQTQISDDQTEQADVLDVLFRCVNTILILFSHSTLLTNIHTNKKLTICILNSLHSPLFLQYGTQLLRQNITSDNIPIRFIFILFTSIDYCTLTITSATFQLLPIIRQLLHIWCELIPNPDDDISPLILRLIRLISRLAISNSDALIRENLCAFFAPHFELLCTTETLINDLVSLLVTLASTTSGKRHLRRLGFVQHILYSIKRHPTLWHPLSLLLIQHDLYQSSILKRLIHLLTQRTIHILQSIATASNDTSFDSTTTSSKNTAAIIALDWFQLLRSSFLSLTLIIDELIDHTKKNINLINILIDTLLSIQHDDDEESLTKLIDIMIDLLWTLTFNSTTNIQDILQKRIDICRWLRMNTTDSRPIVRLASQAILSTFNSGNKNLARSTLNRRSSSTMPLNFLLCMLNADESHHELCVTLRDRLQIEQQYSVELITTSSCQSLDSFIQLLERSSLCLFCAGNRMKSDNLAHFAHRFLSLQHHPIPLLTVQIEYECDFDGNWLENTTIVDMHSVFSTIQRHLCQTSDIDTSHPMMASSLSTSSHTRNTNPDLGGSLSRNFMNCPVPYWSSDDVTEWCEATQGNFETLQPLVMRLNGSALVHLAEILAIEPASMYHSLNDELLQRTGSSVPLTEYVSLQSELQRLLLQRQNQRIAALAAKENIQKNHHRKKKWKHSRLCTLL